MTQFCGSTDDKNVYVKGSNLSNYDMIQVVQPQGIASLMLQEAGICEEYLKKPPKNVARYLGYVTGQDGRVRGLCFDRYPELLRDRMYARRLPDVLRCVQDIRAGLEFLHNNRLAHNDIHAGNIMLDDKGNAVIIDFDSCRKDGAALGLKPGIDLSLEMSAMGNDFAALEKLETELKEAWAGLSWLERLL